MEYKAFVLQELAQRQSSNMTAVVQFWTPISWAELRSDLNINSITCPKFQPDVILCIPSKHEVSCCHPPPSVS